MYCITRQEMKFNDLTIPARTKGTIITTNNCNSISPNCCIKVRVEFSFSNISRDDIYNDLEKNNYPFNPISKQTGIVVTLPSKLIYLVSTTNEESIPQWQAEKLLSNEKLKKIKHQYNKHNLCYYIDVYVLRDIIDELEQEFSDWVQKNCTFETLTEENVDDHPLFEVGDRILENISNFEDRKLEYQNKLENATGYTYDFKGGLIWA